MIFCTKLYHLTKNFLAQFALLAFILEQLIFISAATAQTLPITSDGSTNTQVTQTASGIDQVNIAAPNSSGLSHNKFTDYNVNSAGQIINNFSSSSNNALASTQIGGLVTANPNLANSGSAKIILNEVTSGNVSQLLGYTEIAGTKADLILANPNGIACSSCGFINTARLFMVAGSSDFDSSGNLGFNLKEQVDPNLYVPLITIDGLGLDISRTSSTDIIASSVKLLSSIYGSDNSTFTIQTGGGRYDFTSKEIAGDNSQKNTQAVFAIDVSAFAKIQSGQIYLIATKKGVGVNMAAEILASSTVNIDANGDVYYSKISAGDTATLKSSATIQSIDSDSEISAPNLNIQANEFKNLGLVSAYNLNIKNSATLNNFGNIEALNLNLLNIGNINNSASIYGENSLNISGANLTNNSAGNIFSPQSYSIILSGMMTNFGLITSGNDLTITTNQLINNSEISAFKNLTITATSSINNSSKILANSDLIIFANSSFTNSGSILSNSKLDLTSAATTNNNEIFTLGNLNLTLTDSFTNFGTIISGATFDIKSSSDITNSGSLKSDADFTINAASLTNSASSLILSGKNLNITAASIINQNTKPSSSNNSGIISLDGNIVLKANSLNNNAGLILGKSITIDLVSATTNSSQINSLNKTFIASAVNFSNSLGTLFSSSSISLDLGTSDQTLTGTITADNIDITANNIINQANVTASDYIKLNATGIDGISGSGNITNEYVGDDIAVLATLEAGTYIDFTAKNNINNYGVILGTTNTTLTATSGNIYNYSTGKIKGGSGTTTINALNGSFNNSAQTSIFTADNNAIFNTNDLNNSGEISVANDLTTNISNDLNNYAKALIWSGNNAIFNVANNLTNTLAEIYVINNLTIQKSSSIDATQNKTASVQNISGNIKTYAGGITIKSEILENKRLLSPIAYKDTKDFWFILEHGSSGRTYIQGSGYIKLPYSLGVSDQDLIYHQTRFVLENTASKSSIITSAKNINFENTTLVNDMSEIYAENNISITTNSLSNPSLSETFGLFLERCEIDSSFSCIMHQENQGIYDKSFLSYIKSGNSLTIVRNNIDETADFIKNDPNIQTKVNITDTAYKAQSTLINNINSYILSETGIINADLSSIINAINDSYTLENGSISNVSNNIFSGNFKINLDSADTTPLVESRSQFTDISKFFGSTYYFDQLGLNSAIVLAEIDRQNRNASATRMLGDSFVETTLILDQIRKLTNDSLYLSQTTTDANAQIKELLDNSVNQFAALGLNAEDVAIKGLTTAQVNSLTKDIVTFELTKVNGLSVLAPKIYLSLDTRSRLLNSNSQTGGTSLANSSTIFGKDSLTIDSPYATLLNGGSIRSGVNLTLNLASLTNKTNSLAQSQIIAGNNLSITTSGNIKNIGANIGAIGALSLTATNGNILNSAIVQTNDANLLSSNSDSYQLALNDSARTTGNISSSLLQNSSIKGGSISINAGNDFVNLGGKISTLQNTLSDGSTSSGNLDVVAGNNVDIETLILHNRTRTSWGTKKKGGNSISDSMSNISSDISSAQNLNFYSTGLSNTATTASINIIGSNISALGNGFLTSDFGNVTIANAVDSLMTQTTASKKGSFSSRLDSVYDYKESAVESNLNFGGDLTVSADLGNLNLIGSTIKTTGDLNIGSFTVAQNTDNSYKTNADGTFQTVDGGSILGVNIKSAELKSEHFETHQKSKLSLGDILDPAKMLKTDIAILKFMLTPSWNSKTLEIENGIKYTKDSSRTNTSDVTQNSSTLNVGGDLMLNSFGDVNITASNIDVTGNALLNVDGNINITSAAETTKSSNKNQTIEIGTIKINEDLSHASSSAGIKGTGSKFEDSLISSNQKSSNLNIAGSLFANVTKTLVSSDLGDITIAASNLTVGGDSIIRTAGDFNLTDAQNTSSYSSKESTLEVEAGVKTGNAYVDAVYAWKAVYDAQNKAVHAAEKVKKMEDLKDQGKASDKAVELAVAQLILAQAAVATAILAAAASTAGAAGTSETAGFYGAAYLNTTSSGVKNTSETSISQASNFIGYGDIDIAANNDLKILGSLLTSTNGNVTLSGNNDIKIEAGNNTLAQTSKQETIYGGGSLGNNGVQLNIGLSSGESDYTKTYYTNSQVSAENGTLTLNSGNDANISGANLLAKNVSLNIGNNLNVSSKQTEEDYSSSGFGFNIGAGFGGTSKNNKTDTSKNNKTSGNIDAGFNISSGDMHRLWVDDITTIKATDSMSVNVGNDLNLNGAAILSDNLALAVSGNTNKKDLQDSFYSESMGFGVSTTVNYGGSQKTVPGTGGQPNSFPRGQTTISANLNQNESNQTVYATIGGLDSTLTSSTNSITNADFEGSLTLDHRFFSKAGRKDIIKNFIELGQNLNKNPLTPMGASVAIENYTGQEQSWKPGDVARFKEKGNEFATAVPGANTIGKSNVIPTDPNDPDYKPNRIYLIGQPLSADPDGYKPGRLNEDGAFVSPAKAIPGMNSMSVFHDKFTENTFLGKEGLLELSIIPAIPINYYGLIGKELRNLYEEPKNNNLTRTKND